MTYEEIKKKKLKLIGDLHILMTSIPKDVKVVDEGTRNKISNKLEEIERFEEKYCK